MIQKTVVLGYFFLRLGVVFSMVAVMRAIGIDTIRSQFGDAPRLVAWLEAHLTEDNEDTAKQLIDAADESPFSLREWTESLLVLGQWLQVRRLEATLEDQIGYVGCACASVSASAGLHSLPSLVEEMLAEYGFERAGPESVDRPDVH